MGLEIDGNEIESRLREAVDSDLVVADAQQLVIDSDAQVAVVVIFIFFEDEIVHRDGRVLLQVLYADAGRGLDGGVSFASTHQGINVVAAVAADDHGHVVIPSGEFDFSRVPLVVVSMAGENGVRIDPRLRTNGVDLAQHDGARPMAAALAVLLGGGA